MSQEKIPDHRWSGLWIESVLSPKFSSSVSRGSGGGVELAAEGDAVAGYGFDNLARHLIDFIVVIWRQ